MITMKIKRVAELITNDENKDIYMRMDMQPTPSWYVLCTGTANWTLVKGKEADRLEDDWYADAAYEDAEVAYGKAKDELKEYTQEQDNEF